MNDDSRAKKQEHEELATLVAEMMAVAERGEGEHLRVVSLQLFSWEKWERLKELARRLKV